MKKNHLSGGLWPVMLTPFKQNNEVDYHGLSTLTDFYLQTGADGLFSVCLSSEMFQLTDEERLKIIKHVIAQAAGVPVIATGTFTSDLEQSADFIKKVFDTGVKTVVIITNQIADAHEDDTIFKKRMEYLMKATENIPLGLYECPDPYKRLLSPELMQWLGQTGRFFYHKDTSCDIEAIRSKLAARKDTTLALYNANTATALSSLAGGAAGISPIGANLYPELYAYLKNVFAKQGSNAELVQLNAQLDMMDAIVDQSYPFSAKAFLQKRGLAIHTGCRIGFEKMKPENYLKLDALMDVFKKIASDYGISLYSA